jgi:hypothetical protein
VKDSPVSRDAEEIFCRAKKIAELADTAAIAVRPSGTGQKSSSTCSEGSSVSSASLAEAKEGLAALDRLWAWLQEDARKRVG